MRSWEQFLSPVTGSSADGREMAVCPAMVLEELTDVKSGVAIHMVIVGILNMHLGWQGELSVLIVVLLSCPSGGAVWTTWINGGC